MTADHRTSERVYAALKSDLLDGMRRSGTFNISALAVHYETSATPVREALLRLVGEGLVDMPDRGGFVPCTIDVERARDLYDINLALALAMLARWAPSSPEWPGTPVSDLKPPADRLFLELARHTQNLEFVAIIGSLNDRMRPIRKAEAIQLSGLRREFDAIEQCFRQGNCRALRRTIVQYHYRRLRNVEKIVAAI
ncbi:GntR family transcriptional regulator [Novosphingobium album (ex Liu et al. 2023)]|uniref:GntR family transcriptional regulator n=1 Tax=Novosphingobium album (ex Liu et al. 2023) TaxID=3031130 RepID=A0ABT5WQH4_9SPHN|nr:GntR family transcriptional regulator [Novosphingobium album (ex Liu et al. 2023)]MDE8652260.1 GntR family transcriptional regulator [Novosphingobium album (ex Liu et al. 2023)]